ncbi:MAG TPA: type II secretion system major pseudopilin GspG [Candidatus Hydrogenedentes bacterium]|nr:type II secretion system major pseudopilin GspG [Candidatus Hydrogenedentota bacterium]
MHETSTTARTAFARRDAGFTLIELMVVIVIIGMLAAIVVPRFMGAAGKASVTAARAQISSFKTSLQMYKLDNNTYPKSAEGLEALIKNEKGRNYLEQEVVPKDPWGNAYIYACPGQNGRDFDIVSLGADGSPGGEGENADIVSWNLQATS